MITTTYISVYARHFYANINTKEQNLDTTTLVNNYKIHYKISNNYVNVSCITVFCMCASGRFNPYAYNVHMKKCYEKIIADI